MHRTYVDNLYEKDKINLKKFFWSEKSITVLTEEIEASSHSHLMLQIFIKRQGILQLNVNGNSVFGNYIVVDRNVKHSIEESQNLDCFILIDATSVASHQLQNKYIKGSGYAILPIGNNNKAFEDFYDNPNQETHNEFLIKLFKQLDISFYINSNYDERIIALFNMLDKYSAIEDSIEEISKGLYLSSSRLSHIFKEQTGVPLKSYIVLRKLQKAYLLLFSGKNITEAAMEAGFYSSSHLADVNKKMMGMTITKALNDSEFLEVDE